MPGLTGGVLIAAIFVCALASLVPTSALYRRLQKRHPAEWADSRHHALTGYQVYAWQSRGRRLGDGAVVRLLDRLRLLQAVAYGLVLLLVVERYLTGR